MAITKTTISLSKEVAATTEDVETFIPATGDFYITKFCGEAAFDTNCAIKIIWDYGGTEEILWSTKGVTVVDLDIERTGDGVKKIAIALDNGLNGTVIMAGMFTIVQEI